jgi:hypothetical protein
VKNFKHRGAEGAQRSFYAKDSFFIGGDLYGDDRLGTNTDGGGVAEAGG